MELLTAILAIANGIIAVFIALRDNTTFYKSKIDNRIKTVAGEELAAAINQLSDKMNELQEKTKVYRTNKEEVIRATLRHDITELYEGNKQNQTLSQNQLQDLNQLYDAYKRMNGNGYIQQLYDIMSEWTIK